MKNTLVSFALLASIVSVSLPAQAHRLWILPAATTLSGEDPWVTFDAAVSNDIFHADYHALALDYIKVTGPDGENVPMENTNTGKHRSNFDLNLNAPGTYKVFMAMEGLNASWETDDGERKSWPGRGQQAKPGEFEKNVPSKAKNLQVSQNSRRVETFVTAGAPSETVLAVTGSGLEMEPITHPNDLYSREPASFRFLIDGDIAANAEVSIIPGGMRYRQGQDEIKLASDESGAIEVTWPEAGMYFMEVEYSDDKADAPATTRRGTYMATFEVLPQ